MNRFSQPYTQEIFLILFTLIPIQYSSINHCECSIFEINVNYWFFIVYRFYCLSMKPLIRPDDGMIRNIIWQGVTLKYKRTGALNDNHFLWTSVLLYNWVQNNFDLLFIETFTDDSPLSTPHLAQEYRSENSLRIWEWNLQNCLLRI